MRGYVKVVVLVFFFLVLYSGVIPGLVIQWGEDENYSHGFLIPLISGYLVWQKRKELRELVPRPSSIGLLGLFLGLLMLIVGNISALNFVMRLSIVLVLSSLIIFLLGWSYLRALLFPIAFLGFMVPLPYILYDAIAFPLQMLAAKVASNSLYFLNIPVYREGNIIHLSSTTLQVVDACSGIRSLMSLLALSMIYAYFTQKEWVKRIALTISAIPIAIVANAFRVSGTGILAHEYGEEVAQGFFHGFSGWGVFVVAFILLFGVGTVLSKVKISKSR